MQLGTFAAHIVIDGVPLKEYDILSESPTKATCWVASEAGKSFGVQWKCHEKRRTAGAKGTVTLDGVSGGHQWMHPGTLGNGDVVTLSRYVDSTTIWDFMFTRVELSDDDALLAKVIPKDFGRICLTIRRGKIHSSPRGVGGEHSKVLGDNKYHERSKKVAVHCVGFGSERRRTRAPRRLKRTLIPNNDPEMSFVFMYQPLSILQANGIAPRPTTVNSEPSELNDRIRNLENELKRLRGQMQANHTEDRKPKRVKKERLDESRPGPHMFDPVEVIDLT